MDIYRERERCDVLHLPTMPWAPWASTVSWLGHKSNGPWHWQPLKRENCCVTSAKSMALSVFLWGFVGKLFTAMLHCYPRSAISLSIWVLFFSDLWHALRKKTVQMPSSSLEHFETLAPQISYQFIHYEDILSPSCPWNEPALASALVPRAMLLWVMEA